jgi:hypothetical protein
LSQERIGVEWGIGLVHKIFPGVTAPSAKRLRWDENDLSLLVAMMLRNCYTCCYGAQHETYFKVETPGLEEYLNDIVNAEAFF